MQNNTLWHCKHFTELTVTELYDLLRLRSEVFVVEQNCIFLDMDTIDKQCYHLFCYQNNELVACCRIIDKNITFPNRTSIGRVANAKSVRGTGIGTQMMDKAIVYCEEFFGTIPIKIGAQLYLQNWYERFGFVSCEDVYVEDGIEHVHMELHFTSSPKFS